MRLVRSERSVMIQARDCAVAGDMLVGLTWQDASSTIMVAGTIHAMGSIPHQRDPQTL